MRIWAFHIGFTAKSAVQNFTGKRLVRKREEKRQLRRGTEGRWSDTDYKREMIERLKTLEARKASLEFTARELDRINSEMTRIQSALKDTTPVSGGESKSEDRLVGLIMAKMELEQIRRETDSYVTDMEKALNSLESEDFYVLDVMFIHKRPDALDQLATSLGVDKSTVHRKKDRAIRNLTRLFYGVLER